MPLTILLHLAAGLLGVFLIGFILWEGFETIVLPRTVSRKLRLTRGFYRSAWPVVSWIARRVCADGKRDLFLAYFGPLSLPVLLSLWAVVLIVGFALVQWAQGPGAAGGHAAFSAALYESGVTFFTLGYGDITPRLGLAQFVAVLEAGVGFFFLALVIGYLPVLYQSFSRREAVISRLDGRASSPPSACEMLRRHAHAGEMLSLVTFLGEWEQWASEILESHLSYPVLVYYRSQHEHQSWLGALSTIMDTCALLIVGVQGGPEWERSVQWQARQTFAMARHTLIDLCYVFDSGPVMPDPDRLPREQLNKMRATLAAAGLPLCDGAEDDEKLLNLRGLYEPYVFGMSGFLMFDLPPWQPAGATQDNWETSAWDEAGIKGTDFHPSTAMVGDD